jgi:hypothetical protein
LLLAVANPEKRNFGSLAGDVSERNHDFDDECEWMLGWVAFNLSPILRLLLGAGTPRELSNRSGQLVLRLLLLLRYGNGQQQRHSSRISASATKYVGKSRTRLRRRFAENRLLPPRPARLCRDSHFAIDLSIIETMLEAPHFVQGDFMRTFPSSS